MDKRANIIDKLEKLSQRGDWHDPPRLPPGDCRDVSTHLGGIFLKTHWRAILEALKRMD